MIRRFLHPYVSSRTRRCVQKFHNIIPAQQRSIHGSMVFIRKIEPHRCAFSETASKWQQSNQNQIMKSMENLHLWSTSSSIFCKRIRKKHSSSTFTASHQFRNFSNQFEPGNDKSKTSKIPDLPDLSKNFPGNQFIAPWEVSNLPPIPISQSTESENVFSPIMKTTRRLLSIPDQSDLQQTFRNYLNNARTNNGLLNRLHLTQSDAQLMLLLPEILLQDVHAAICHFSRQENFYGMPIPVSISNKKSNFDINGENFSHKKSFNNNNISNREEKVPGPIICIKLLELIGIPHYYISNTASPFPVLRQKVIVHSSQIDQIIDCCLHTTTALARSCRAGKYSLIGYDFSSTHDPNESSVIKGGGKSAAHVAEEIWRCVRGVEIKYTTGEGRLDIGSSTGDLGAGFHLNSMKNVTEQPPLRIGRVGSVNIHLDPFQQYITSSTTSDKFGRNGRDEAEPVMGCSENPGEHASTKPQNKPMIQWNRKDQRRYDVSLLIFNSVLDAFSKLGSSSTGSPFDLRRNMVQSAERLLLEVAGTAPLFSPSRTSHDSTMKRSPYNVLQITQPDAYSFNIVMHAWSQLCPRSSRSHSSDDGEEGSSSTIASAAAERIHSILDMMYELSEEERAERTTYDSIAAAIEKSMNGSNDDTLVSRTISPNASSYNAILTAWSNCSDRKSASKALDLFRTMVERYNISCHARDALVRNKCQHDLGSSKPRRDVTAKTDSFPDSRTLVALLKSIEILSSSMEFEDALKFVDSIREFATEVDGQNEWSHARDILPPSGKRKPDRIFNVFVCNSIIRTYSNLPVTTLEEYWRCCERIDDLIESLESSHSLKPDVVTRGMAIHAWEKSRRFALEYSEKEAKNCAKMRSAKARVHADAILSDMQSTRLTRGLLFEKPLSIICDVIAMHGLAGETAEAEELYLHAREGNNSYVPILAAIVEALASNGTNNILHVKKAHQFLSEFENDIMKSNPRVLPDMKFTRLYNAVIAGYINSTEKTQGIELAKTLLTHMIEKHTSNPQHIARPNTTTFVQVMAALAREGDNTQQLAMFLRKMDEINNQSKLLPAELAANVVPNKVVYELVLKSHARSSSKGSNEHLSALLDRIKKDPNISSDELSQIFDSYELPQHSKNGYCHGETKQNSSYPMLKSYKKMFHAHLKKRTTNGAEAATALLREMEDKYASGENDYRPDIYMFNTVMNAWQQCELSNKDTSISPSEKAEELLDYVCKKREEGVGCLAPNDLTFSICLHSWCKSSRRDAPKRAENILRRKIESSKENCDIVVSSTDWNSAIAKWREDPTEGPDRARKLFIEMNQRYINSQDERSAPNVVTVNTLLDVYAKSKGEKSAEEAEAILNKIIRSYKSGEGVIVPNIISFRSCMDAWIRRREPETPKRVYSLLKSMIEFSKSERWDDVAPDSDSFNFVLKACMLAPVMWHVPIKGDDHPIAIANDVFSTLRNQNEFNANATHTSYSYMFRIYKRHLDFTDTRYSPLTRMLWKHCCHDGQVSKFSFESFRSSVSESEFWSSIGGKERYEKLGKATAASVTVNDLPAKWKRNVAPDRRQTLTN